MTGADILVECLLKQGIRVIFGMPGSITRDIYSVLYKKRNVIRHITARHEGGACLMAEGYALVTGDVGVCLTVPGPGATNAYTGMLEAYTANVPLLLITAQHEAGYSKKDIEKMTHGLDQVSAFRAVTKCIRRVEKVGNIPGAVSEIFESLRSGRPKPALLEITRDALTAKADLEIPDWADGVRLKAADEQILSAVDLLYRARHPFIIAGNGVYHSDASEELLKLAKLLNAPIATSGLGKGVLSEDEDICLGYIGNPVVKKALEEADLCLAIGTRFVHADTESWSLKMPQTLIHIDAESSEINCRYPATLGITGDAKPVLKQIIEAVSGKELQGGWDGKLNSLKERINSLKKPLYVQMLRETIARDAILSIDVHMGSFLATKYFKVYETRSFIHSHISMAMGYGLPAAIGAKVAFPERQVVAFCGDGGFMLSSPEFLTAIQHNINVVVVVINNNGFSTIKDVQQNHFGRTIGVDLHNPDFMKFAEACGAHGFRVTDINEFKPVLEKALKMDKPVLIEVIHRGSILRRVYNTTRRVGRYLKQRRSL